MAVMKQMNECLTNAFDLKVPPPSQKWKGFIRRGENNEKVLVLFHYHHLVMVYHIESSTILYEWWEKPTDKRGLDSAKEWLEERRRSLLKSD